MVDTRKKVNPTPGAKKASPPKKKAATFTKNTAPKIHPSALADLIDDANNKLDALPPDRYTGAKPNSKRQKFNCDNLVEHQQALLAVFGGFAGLRGSQEHAYLMQSYLDREVFPVGHPRAGSS